MRSSLTALFALATIIPTASFAASMSNDKKDVTVQSDTAAPSVAMRGVVVPFAWI